MKKHLFLSLAFIATACAESAVVSAPSCVPNHGGFYAGLGVGASMATVETDAASYVDYLLPSTDYDVDTSFSSKTIKKTKTGFSGGIKTGYGFQFNEFYVAPEIEFIVHAGKKIKDTFTLIGKDSTPATTTMTGTPESKLKYSANFAVKAGYVFGNSLVYLKSGVSLLNLSNKFESNYKTDSSVAGAVVPLTANEPKSKKTNHVGWLIGGGYEYAITKNIVGFADVSCSFYNSKDISVGDDSAQKITVKPKTVTTALVGIKYKI